MTVTVEVINQGSLNLLKDMAKMGLIHLHTSTKRGIGKSTAKSKKGIVPEAHGSSPVQDETEYLLSTPSNRERMERILKEDNEGKLITFETLEQAIQAARH